MATTNIIPSYLTGGSFEAVNPFDIVVDVNKYYTLEAIRSVAELQGDNKDIYSLVFQPAGIAQTDYQTYINALNAVAGAGIVVLVGNDGSRVYVPTTYLKSFPLKDGVSYERICLIADLGPCPPSVATELNDVITHIKNYIQANFGLTPTVKLGTMPTIGYVTAEQASVFEATRQNAITNANNDVVTVALQSKTISSQQVYISELEAQVIALNSKLTAATTPASDSSSSSSSNTTTTNTSASATNTTSTNSSSTTTPTSSSSSSTPTTGS